MFNNNPPTIIDFCAGYGGLGLGVERAVGKTRPIAFCELEGFAQANLISKMEAGLLAQAPIWSNLLTFPYSKFRGLVDIAVAGIPCQPHSTAGKRKGGADERFLFADWLGGLELMQPGYIFIENVEGLLSSKMPDGTLCIQWTVERLEAMAYRVEVGLFSAAEVGAPHQRKRVFILGMLEHSESTGVTPDTHRRGKPQSLNRCEVRDRGTAAGRTDLRELANNSNKGLQGLWERSRSKGWEVETGYAGGCSDLWPSRPNQEQYDWEPPRVTGGSLKPPLGRNPHGTPDRVDDAELCVSCDSRVDELRLLGNGVVPATAERAWRVLNARLMGFTAGI